MVAYATRGCLFILCCGLFAVPLKRISGNPRFFMANFPHNHLFLLNLPIMELPLSESFKLRSKLMGFFTLSDVLQADLSQLHGHGDYSEKWYFELINFLKRKNLLHLLDSNQ